MCRRHLPPAGSTNSHRTSARRHLAQQTCDSTHKHRTWARCHLEQTCIVTHNLSIRTALGRDATMINTLVEIACKIVHSHRTSARRLLQAANLQSYAHKLSACTAPRQDVPNCSKRCRLLPIIVTRSFVRVLVLVPLV